VLETWYKDCVIKRRAFGKKMIEYLIRMKIINSEDEKIEGFLTIRRIIC